ncbi:glycolate oxidase subunit GlcE [Sulfuriferula plumbiphila]|uniref:Glycolate oxidase subunit GlcE n=1 Tax=Sulfuriferula plumbiphila TaxID=171865 RepID=A0A512L558_9PROT|nr:glycolate oxidase subunit GlcE [Sulfuriferula plumbiphila]BBP05853.1 glycolate oxidase subunit GlcE [Sulfuriferula plumbiphila]GEP29623.1 glycolate oxidase subunit GlcE [Sulfuriferula plumbiphila]
MQAIIDKVHTAIAAQAPLQIRAGGSKDWYGNAPLGELLDISMHRGVVEYEPVELVLTAKAGTPLAEIEALLAANGQMLSFEPPHYGAHATLGGTLACGFSGPRRAHAGSARDALLGVQLLDGRGDVLNFGGKVIKNVAGYDVSRLMAGALGTLGVILQASLKVLPRPANEITLQFELDQGSAIARMNQLAGQALPISAAAWVGGVMMLRLEGSAAGIHAAQVKLGGEVNPHGAAFWLAAREQTAALFAGDMPLWRLSVPATTPPIALPGKQAVTWGGAQRWLKSDAPPGQIRSGAARAGGHATLFRAADKSAGVFQPLPKAMLALHQRLKQHFDPHGIFNRGRLYAEF